MELKEFSKALTLFKKIKSEYPASYQGGNIDQYISSAEFAAKN